VLARHPGHIRTAPQYITYAPQTGLARARIRGHHGAVLIPGVHAPEAYLYL
jgi:hypothetical protein